jgi:hypothetical protein
MSVIESFEELKDQVVKADGELLAVAEKDEPTIETKAADARREADEQADKLKAATQRTADGADSRWQEIQADWDRHRARMKEQLENAKTGYDLSVAEAEAETAEAEALDAIAFAASAVLDAQAATLDALLARRRAVAMVAS